jgi:hypothetical protein
MGRARRANVAMSSICSSLSVVRLHWLLAGSIWSQPILPEGTHHWMGSTPLDAQWTNNADRLHAAKDIMSISISKQCRSPTFRFHFIGYDDGDVVGSREDAFQPLWNELQLLVQLFRLGQCPYRQLHLKPAFTFLFTARQR